MTEKVIYRQETQDDFQEVFEINHKAFGQQNEAKLVNALRNNSNVFIPELSIVATKNNAIIGHILFTKINIKSDDETLNESLGLAPMAVLPEFQKNGIGGQLIRRGLETAKQLGYQSVIVLGHEDYYPKFGFEPAEKWNIKAPFDVPSNVFMAIELVKDSLENISGTVIYPKEFETV
ncbi:MULTISPECIES: GNAT family N-acetyltransferase [Chryseobacterium]|uniref:GNAT family N-acetyltransferase n=1 Tax=Chryseobacterium TaxID=59732 RepID=UPI00195F1655|nr:MULTISPECIES: N-acetyltransferase [Chryseobacterium]MBM7420819.1 putative N-acetyltransferase YhbS [Chryseobacterium sp. JUb44]MDH6210773.1 putative acetyltransferase [Chryseobacterium sp. BIGb0186]WSO09452.1 N-acetyltransferase [Chryseobacterium scophthalmum]